MFTFFIEAFLEDSLDPTHLPHLVAKHVVTLRRRPTPTVHQTDSLLIHSIWQQHSLSLLTFDNLFLSQVSLISYISSTKPFVSFFLVIGWHLFLSQVTFSYTITTWAQYYLLSRSLLLAYINRQRTIAHFTFPFWLDIPPRQPTQTLRKWCK